MKIIIEKESKKERNSIVIKKERKKQTKLIRLRN